MSTPRPALHLTIATPVGVLADLPVRAVRAEDDSGSFGILPGHADFVTVLRPCVVSWQSAEGADGCCAVDSGVLSVTAGAAVSIACREGVAGGGAAALSALVAAARDHQRDEDRGARVEATRLQTQAIRQLMQYLRPALGLPADGTAALLVGERQG